jgi:chromosome partitioning protein
MGKIIVFVNQKGGVGKTTTTANLGAYMAEAGKKILLVDFDPQANLTSCVGAKSENVGVYEIMMGQASFEQAVQKTKISNLEILTSSIHLTGATVELVNEEGRDFYLKNILKEHSGAYDYVLIDCPPSLGILTMNGLAASDYVMVPLQCEYFALEGLSLLLKTIELVQQSINPELKIGGIMFTMYDSRTNLANEVVQEITGYFKDLVFKTIIPRNVRLSESPSHGLTINLYDASCVGAKSYYRLSQEVLARV